MLRLLTLCCLFLTIPAALAEPLKSCERLWAHRGDTRASAPESVEAALEALRQNAGGTEVDVLWIPQKNDFIVAHDDADAAAGPELLFNDWLQTVPSDFPVWVDAKNFSQLWPWEVAGASARLHAILQQHKRLDYSIVESRNPWYLSSLHELGIHTMYRTDLKNHRSDWLNQAHAGLAGWLYSFGPFSAISTDLDRYNGATADYLKDQAPIYLSTANSVEEIGSLLQRPEVKVILVDTRVYQHPDC